MFNWFFLVAVLLATPVLAIVAVVRSVGLGRQLLSLEDKISVLERPTGDDRHFAGPNDRPKRGGSAANRARGNPVPTAGYTCPAGRLASRGHAHIDLSANFSSRGKRRGDH